MPRNQRAMRRPGKQGLDKAILFLLVLGLLLICLPGPAQEEEGETFKGIGLHIKLRGAWVAFLGGDIDKGTAGIYDRQVAEITSAGFELASNDKKPFHNGYELAGDIVYYFTPRIGLGVGGSMVRAKHESTCLFRWPGTQEDYPLMGLPEMKILSLRLGVFYVISISRLLNICVSAGPEYHFADYTYYGTLTTPYSAGFLAHDAEARELGIYGGLGLEISLNKRLAFIIEAFGRYAKISGLEGKEVTYEWYGGQSTTIEEHGVIFFIGDEPYPRLDIPTAGSPPGQGAREAVFDLSGVSLQAGLNFKF